MLTNKSRAHSSAHNCEHGEAKRNVVGAARFVRFSPRNFAGTVRKSSDWPTGVLFVLETHSFASGLDGECIILGDNKLFSICAGWTKNKGN